MNIERMKRTYQKAQRAYYAGSPVMTDDEFDRLEEKIRKLDPDWAALRATGSEKINKKSKVELVEFMPSLSKHYPHQVDGWLTKRKGPWLLMPKLDGSSVQATYRDGRLYQLVTRGNGIVGQDITFLAKFTTLPQVIKHKGLFRIRCEAVMSRKVWQDKYSKISENPRNLVAGILNRKLDKDSTYQLRDVHFVVLGVYGMKLREGLSVALASGFEVIHHVRKINTNSQYLSQLLTKRRTNYQYEIDGLVLAPANQVFKYKDAERPDWTTAFKENLSDDDAPIVTVKQIVWQISQSGRWTPKVEIEPVRLDGVTVSKATAHNAKWLMEHGIGPGAKIRIVRSGGVIPKITGVVKKAKCELPEGPTHWKGRYLYADRDNEQSDLIEYKKAEYFLQTCGVEGIKLKTIQKMKVNVLGLCKLAASTNRVIVTTLLRRGFGDVQAQNIAKELGKFRDNGVTLQQLLVGTSVFTMGVGDRKLGAASKVVPLEKLVDMKEDQIRRTFADVRSFGESTVAALVEGLAEFRKIYPHLKNYVKVVKPKAPKKVKDGKFRGWAATWTGYRNKDEEAAWVAGGGEIVPFGSKTKVLFCRADGKISGKVAKAYERGDVAVLTWDEVKNRVW